MHEGDRLPPYALLSGSLQELSNSNNGQETSFSTLPAGEIFAAPALLGDGCPSDGDC